MGVDEECMNAIRRVGVSVWEVRLLLFVLAVLASVLVPVFA